MRFFRKLEILSQWKPPEGSAIDVSFAYVSNCTCGSHHLSTLLTGKNGVAKLNCPENFTIEDARKQLDACAALLIAGPPAGTTSGDSPVDVPGIPGAAEMFAKMAAAAVRGAVERDAARDAPSGPSTKPTLN